MVRGATARGCGADRVWGGEPARELVLGLFDQLAELQERIGRLEEQSRRSSRNSSSPPSQDQPKTRAERRREAREKAKKWAKQEGEKRKQGAQPGHKGCGRKLLPEDQMNEIRHHYPEQCRDCGRELQAEETPGETFGRHQVADLAPVAIIYTEHRTHHLPCPCCGETTAGQLPAEVRGSPFGAGVQAAVVTLTARNRVSRRDMPELAWELSG